MKLYNPNNPIYRLERLVVIVLALAFVIGSRVEAKMEESSSNKASLACSLLQLK